MSPAIVDTALAETEEPTAGWICLAIEISPS